MADISSVEIPKPLNWQDFQRCCVPLFRNVIRDPQLQEWGREGQQQHGIDLFGLRDRDPKQPVGIQCKRTEESITERIIRSEIEKARNFKPNLTELIFATTSQRDAKIQAIAAQISQELHDSGWSCRITIMGWNDLRLEIARYPDALDAFLPTGRGFDQPLMQEFRQSGAATQAKLELLLERTEWLSASRAVSDQMYDVELEPEAKSEPPNLHAEITTYRNLIRKGQEKIPLEELTRLLSNNPPPYARYRILSNISAMNLGAGRYASALDFARQAYALRSTDVKAQTNLAFAELANGDLDAAAKRAETALLEHPDYGPAASVLLQARSKDENVSDPYAIVPAATYTTAEFGIGAIVFLRNRGDLSWRATAIEAAAAHPGNESLARLSAEAELDPILNDPGTLLGKQVGVGVIEKVKQCAGVLKAIWAKEIAVEQVNLDEIVPLAANLASAWRYAENDVGSADVLDRTMAKAGRHPILLRARAILYLHAGEDLKAVELLVEARDDPEAQLFTAQVLAAKQPDRALEYLEGVACHTLPHHLRSMVYDVRAEIAIASSDAEAFRAAIREHEASGGPFVARALLKARGRELGLFEEANLLAVAPEAELDGSTIEHFSSVPSLSPNVQELIHSIREREAELGFADRLQIAQFLNNHNIFDVASDLLAGRVNSKQDTAGLRMYLESSISAQLTARAQAVLIAIPTDVAQKPFYQKMAAALHWNTGDAKAATPLIEATYLASPANLHLFLWYVDALMRGGGEDRVRELLSAPVEDTHSGTISQKSRLALVLVTFGQPERALKLAYRCYVLNRDSPEAWMGLMSVMLGGDKLEELNLLSETIGPAHSFEVRFEGDSVRRYLIETDETIRNVEHEALPPNHPVARAVQGLRPGDILMWPVGETSAEIISAKHKYLDAFHVAMARYNERFPNATGLKTITIKTEGDDAYSELKAQLIARSEYVISICKQYAEGKLSLTMLAHMTGADPIEVMLGLRETGTAYRVSTGLEEERLAALKAISANNGVGCVVDAATYHCIRRSNLEAAVAMVCGKIGVTQATLDLYQSRVQSPALKQGGVGTMGYREGKFILTELTEAQKESIRATIASDVDWLIHNADILPARPVKDPPSAFRRLGSIKGARFFDDVYAANGSGRILLVDDFFTRQVASLIGTSGTSLQPVLMTARDRDVLSLEDYARAITDLADIGQEFISIDPLTLTLARRLDREIGEETVGRCFKIATRLLGGKRADADSHSSVAAAFLEALWSSKQLQPGDYQATSHLLRELLKDRSGDYQVILDALDQRLARRINLRLYLRQWAQGHFLKFM